MPMEEEGIKFTIDTTQAQDNVSKLTQEIELLNAKLRLEKELYLEGTTTMKEYQAASRELTMQLKLKNEALTDLIGTEAGETGFKGLSKGIFNTERMLNTAMTGGSFGRFGPMLEGITTSLGMTSGVGFALGGLAVAFQSLIPHIEKFFEAVDEEKFKKISENMKKLVESMQAAPTRAEKTTEERVREAITERKMPVVAAQVEKAMAQTTELESYITPEDRQAWEALKTHPGDFANPQAAREAILQRARENRARGAQELVAQLPTSRAAREVLRGLGRKAPGILGRQFMTELDLAEPEAQAAMKAEIAGETAAGKEMETTRERIKKWNETGKIQQHIMDTENKRAQADWEHGTALQEHIADQMDAEKRRNNIEAARIKMQGDREQETAARRAEREGAPEARLRGMEEAVKQQVTALALQNRPADFTPQMVADWVRQALQDLPMQGGNMAMALQQALGEVRMHLMRQAEQQNNQWQNWQGMGLFNPTMMGRGGGG